MGIDFDKIHRDYPIVEVIGRVVKLKGSNAPTGCCPFHTEKTPSFTVYPKDHRYHCYGCGAHGDVLDFVRETQRLGDVSEAIAWLTGGAAPKLDPADVERRKRDRERQEAKQQRLEQDAIQAARQRWAKAKDATADNGYLKSKNVKPHDCRVEGDLLLVPIYAPDGLLQSVQAIAPGVSETSETHSDAHSDADGWPKKGKRFHTGAPVKGGAHVLLGQIDGPVVIAEGYATAATIRETTGYTAVIAFSQGGLKDAAQMASRRWPGQPIIVAADTNGIKKAQAAAASVGGRMVIPRLPPGAGTDFNDLACLSGPDEVRAAFSTPDTAQNAVAPRAGFGFQGVRDLVRNIRPIDWLVEDAIERDSLAVIYGEPGHGKSFVAIDFACSVATGTDWHGKPVKQGAVFYIAGEGHNGLGRRFAAWQKARGVEIDNLYLSTRAAALTNAASAHEVAEAVREIVDATGVTPALIVVDTLARNFGAADENSAADMGAFVANIDNELRHPWKATVAIVHHSGKDQSRGARGSTALRGAVDAEYEVSKDEAGTIRIQSHKMKDAEAPAPMSFTLKPVPLNLLDKDGNTVFGVALEPCDYVAPVRAASRVAVRGEGKNQTTALRVLEHLEAEHRSRLEKAGRDPGGATVLESDWRAILARDHGIDRRRFPEIRRSMVANGLIEGLSGGYIRTIKSGDFYPNGVKNGVCYPTKGASEWASECRGVTKCPNERPNGPP